MVEEGLLLLVPQERGHHGVEEFSILFVDKEVELVGCIFVIFGKLVFGREMLPFEDEAEVLNNGVLPAESLQQTIHLGQGVIDLEFRGGKIANAKIIS